MPSLGVRGPIATPEMCNGLMVPVSRSTRSTHSTARRLSRPSRGPEKIAPKTFEPAAREVFDRMMHMADNAGAMDEHRALNYLAMRYPGIYARAAEAFGRDFSLTGVEVRPRPWPARATSSMSSSHSLTATPTSPRSPSCGWT